MTKLSDTQRVILAAACQRPDRRVLPLPGRLKGGAAAKVITSLVAKGLIQEVEAQPGDAVWREADAGHGVTLVATDAALPALGIDEAEEAAPTPPHGKNPRRAGKTTRRETPPAAPADAPARKARADSKQAQLIAMLKRPKGASLAEIAAAFGWQAHTVRGAIASALKKKLGLAVTSEKVEKRGRVYRIA